MQRNRDGEFFDVPDLPKDHWHSFGLQNLKASRFVDVVDDILQGRHKLITPSRRPRRGKAVFFSNRFG